MATLKTSGPKLKSQIRGGVDDFPREFLNRVGFDIYDQENPPVFDPSSLVGLLIESKCIQVRTDERKKTDTFLTDDPTKFPLVSYVKLPDGQIGTKTRTLVKEGSPLPTLTALFQEADQHNLGNGFTDQSITTKPTIFNQLAAEVSIKDNTPPEFSSLVKTFTESLTAGGQATNPPVLAAGELSRREEQTDLFDFRRTRTYRNLASLPQQIIDSRTNKFKQVETVTKIWELDSTTPLTPTALRDVNFKKLGDGTAVEEQVTIASVFGQLEAKTSSEVVTPIEFRALLKTYTEGLTQGGTVTNPPVLGTNEVTREEQQQDLFTFRRTRTYRDAASLPITLTGSRTNKYKQIETVTKTLELDSTVPAVPTALLDVSFRKLGDGTAVEEQVAIPSVFLAAKYEASKPNLIPPEMRAAVPIIVTEGTASGTAVPPTLIGTQLSVTDQQIDLFTHRVSITDISAVTLPVSITSKEITEEYGGGALDLIRTLASVGTLTLDSGLNYVSSSIKNLGNNLELKETRVLHSGTWPVLESRIWDDEMQVYRIELEQVVVAGTLPTSGTYFNDSVKAIDQWRSKLIRTTRTPTAVGVGSAIVTAEFKPFSFPGTFDYVTWLNYAHGMGFRQSTAMLCKHVIKTWWLVRNPGPPTIGAVGSGSDVEIDEIFVDTVTLPVYSGGSVIESQKFPSVLHDAITTTQGLFFPATNPSFTLYRYGTLSGGTTTQTVAYISNPGTGYNVGNVVNIPGFGNVTVTSVGVGNSILGFSPVSSGTVPDSNSIASTSTSGPGAITGGSGSGATGGATSITWNLYTPGTAWIGSTRVVAVKISQTEVPFLWKIQTKSVVMR